MGLDFSALSIADPLGLSAVGQPLQKPGGGSTNGANGSFTIGTGDLMQELVGFHSKGRSGLEDLYGKAGQAFSIEKF